jgi:hypothetical protein
MDFGGFQKMLETWASGNRLGEPIMTLCEIIALSMCLFYSLRTNIGRAFFAYILFDFVIALFDYYLIYFSKAHQRDRYNFIYASNAWISAIELWVYYYFFFRVIQNSAVKLTMKILLIVFTIGFVVLAIFRIYESDSFRYTSEIIGAAEFLFLLLPCFTYYFELLAIRTTADLFKRPSFWIVTGIFFYSAISIPYYLIGNFLQVNNYHSQTVLLLMFYIPCSISFLFLTKAFLCKKILTN